MNATLKSTINKFPPGTPVQIQLDPTYTVELGTSYDIILPDGTKSWAYRDEIEWSESCQPSHNTPTSAA